MKRFATAIVIHAAPEKIWSLLTDVQGWAKWNTTVSSVGGKVALGEKVTIRTKLAPGRAFPVKVAVLDAPRKMVWRGGMPIGFLFKGERTFLLKPKAVGAVEFSMEEVFDGLLSGLITKSIPDLQSAFEEFAACLKREAERSP